MNLEEITRAVADVMDNLEYDEYDLHVPCACGSLKHHDAAFEPLEVTRPNEEPRPWVY